MFLAQPLILLDRYGIVRYIQIVPEDTNLTDMEKKFDKARKLCRNNKNRTGGE
jgi:hypothetical protein